MRGLSFSFHPQPRPIGQDQFPFFDGDANIGVVVNQQVAIEVGVVYKGREVSGGSNCQRTLDHAANHDAQVVRACDVNHFERVKQCRRIS